MAMEIAKTKMAIRRQRAALIDFRPHNFGSPIPHKSTYEENNFSCVRLDLIAMCVGARST